MAQEKEIDKILVVTEVDHKNLWFLHWHEIIAFEVLEESLLLGGGSNLSPGPLRRG